MSLDGSDRAGLILGGGRRGKEELCGLEFVR